MKFILGKKKEMTQKFLADGSVVPVTAVKAGPCFVTQVKKSEKDAYQAVQVGYQENNKKISKPLAGHLKKGKFKAKYLKEFRLPDEDNSQYQEGQKITAAVFAKGEKVKVSAISKGKGFQGVVKRHSFSGAPKSHGTKDQLRHPGSIGAGGAHHVFKGKRMAGRMGGKKVTIANLEIIDIEPENNILFIKGAVPGRRNSLIEIRAPGKMELAAPEEPKEQKVPAAGKAEEGEPKDQAKEIKKENATAEAEILAVKEKKPANQEAAAKV